MSEQMVDKIARAVLYEGYLLYPYRQSALKNQQRWNFGVLYPPAWAVSQTGSDRSYFQMECLAQCGAESRLDISVRCLQLVQRDSGERTWQEAIEREARLDALSPKELVESPRFEAISLDAGDEAQLEVIRRRFAITGRVEISAVPMRDSIYRLTLRVSNLTDLDSASGETKRGDALMRSLASAHAILRIWDGEFVSQTDPPEELKDFAAQCQNVGVWPVLAGENGARDVMLGSPIILSDHPQIAPESKGDLFDGAEIDEILTLRILTLTDAEKEEMRRSDERGRQILERLEASPAEHLLELHGKIRAVEQPQGDPWSAWDTLTGAPVDSALVSGTELKKGDRVRLRPRKRADIFDTLLEGKIAIIDTVEEDYEGNIHLAVVMEDDPGRDLGEMRQAGHRFFYSVDEVEPVAHSGIGQAQ